jgi:hypothetical protein
MKNILCAVLILWAGAAFAAEPEPATVVAGWDREATVEWGYTPPTEPALSGFQLYQEGAKACQWAGAETRSGDCTLRIAKRDTPFTLTALFADGTESPHSAPFVFTDVLPAPVLKSLKVTVEFVQ